MAILSPYLTGLAGMSEAVESYFRLASFRLVLIRGFVVCHWHVELNESNSGGQIINLS